MTFKKLISNLAELVKIAETDNDSEAGKLAIKILQKDVTAHNVLEIEKLLNAYHRNR